MRWVVQKHLLIKSMPDWRTSLPPTTNCLSYFGPVVINVRKRPWPYGWSQTRLDEVLQETHQQCSFEPHSPQGDSDQAWLPLTRWPSGSFGGKGRGAQPCGHARQWGENPQSRTPQETAGSSYKSMVVSKAHGTRSVSFWTSWPLPSF